MSKTIGKVARYWGPPLGLCGLLVVIAKLGASTPEFEPTTLTMLSTVVLVVGLFVFSGNSGVISFGHVGFVAIGAYTSALLTIPHLQKSFLLPDLPGWLAGASVDPALAALAGGVVCALVAALIGFPLMRLAGIAAGIATLAFLLIVNLVASNWTALTGGQGTLVVPLNETVNGMLVWAGAAIAIAWVFQRSRWGVRVHATRDEPVAASALGISPARERLRAFVLSAFITGIGGALYGHVLGAFSPGPEGSFYFQLTFILIAMLVIGGVRSLSGAVLGVIVVTALSELMRRINADLQQVGLAVAMLLVLIGRPAGLLGSKELGWPSWLLRRTPADQLDLTPKKEEELSREY